MGKTAIFPISPILIALIATIRQNFDAAQAEIQKRYSSSTLPPSTLEPARAKYLYIPTLHTNYTPQGTPPTTRKHNQNNSTTTVLKTKLLLFLRNSMMGGISFQETHVYRVIFLIFTPCSKVTFIQFRNTSL
ncbi:hypothetical protein F4804DRAFT_296321 [Jackrogersella minutella]|nr:hypothetical protein F4804DRAFT_296321 [Jackrogersella minutella]